MKYAFMALLAMAVAATVRSDREDTHSPSAAKATNRGMRTELLSVSSIPLNRAFRCPITFSGTTNTVASTTVPGDIGFALSSVTLANVSTNVFASFYSELRLLVETGQCSEIHTLPLPANGENTLAVTGFDGRRLVFDPPLILRPGDPLSFELLRFSIAAQAYVAPVSSNVTIVVGGYVLYPGEF